MIRILFVCTGNIFRSRFAEEVFNHLCKTKNVNATAFSAGLKVGKYRQRKMYKPALIELKRLEIIPSRSDEDSIHINDIDISIYDQIICMDRQEHKPMVDSNQFLSSYAIKYWDIVDMPKVSSQISLPKCYKKVDELVKQLH